MSEKIYNHCGEELDPDTLIPIKNKVDFNKIDLSGNPTGNQGTLEPTLSEEANNYSYDENYPVGMPIQLDLDLMDWADQELDVDDKLLCRISYQVPNGPKVVLYNKDTTTCASCKAGGAAVVRLNTQYCEESRNWDVLCESCEADTRQHYEELWNEYYSDLGSGL